MNKEPVVADLKMIPLWRAPHPEFLTVIFLLKQVANKSSQMTVDLSQLSAVKIRGKWDSLTLHC